MLRNAYGGTTRDQAFLYSVLALTHTQICEVDIITDEETEQENELANAIYK